MPADPPSVDPAEDYAPYSLRAYVGDLRQAPRGTVKQWAMVPVVIGLLAVGEVVSLVAEGFMRVGDLLGRKR